MKKKIIETNLLCKSFITDGAVNNIIKNIDLDIFEGDFTVIMGSSGSGKSTLLYTISGMDKVTSGTVILDEENITNLNERQMGKIRKEKLGFVFQGINLVPNLTVYENILSPTYNTKRKKSEIETNINELLDKL